MNTELPEPQPPLELKGISTAPKVGLTRFAGITLPGGRGAGAINRYVSASQAAGCIRSTSCNAASFVFCTAVRRAWIVSTAKSFETGVDLHDLPPLRVGDLQVRHQPLRQKVADKLRHQPSRGQQQQQRSSNHIYKGS